jgi:HD-GYP domain-containing protein (c-di-GMP phosphodiesterase class II)
MNEQTSASRIVLAALDGQGDKVRWEHHNIVRIGTQTDLEVVLTEPTVSPHHATLALTEGGWTLEEAQTGTGTFLNGMPVTKPQKVERDDVIHCGRQGLRITDLEDPTVWIHCRPHLPKENAGASPAGLKVDAVTHRSWEEGLRQLSDASGQASGKHLFTLLRAGYHLSRVNSLQELLQSVLDDTVAVLNAKQGTMLLIDEATGKLAPFAHSSLGPRKSGTEFSMSLASRCFMSGESMLCSDVSALSESARHGSLAEGSMSSVICAMLRSPRQRLGVLHLYRISNQEPFNEEELQLADAIAASVSVGVECAQIIEKHREPFLQKITDFVGRAVALRDPHTGKHSKRVQAYAMMLAEQMGAPWEEYQRIRLGARLHDLGKLVIADAVLNKPGWLTQEEMEKMRQATLRGVALAGAFPELAPILPIIRSHHERWDGTGYPDGLKGACIPYGARVVAIANCFDAMTVDQPYRAALSLEDAFAELKAGAGTQFDPAFVETFLNLRPKLEALVTKDQQELRQSVGSSLPGRLHAMGKEPLAAGLADKV